MLYNQANSGNKWTSLDFMHFIKVKFGCLKSQINYDTAASRIAKNPQRLEP